MNNTDLNTIYYGSSITIPEPFSLNAGRFNLIYQNGLIRQIRYDSNLICNRVYFALRDRHWNTIPGAFSITHQSTNSTGFDLLYKGEFLQGDIKLEASFELHGKSSGEITFSFTAVALTSFYRNRIGFCTLLPIDECMGKKYRVIQSDNQIINSIFPKHIVPWQPNIDIKSISYALSDNANVTATFDGDLFEMEDQRNWTDYSYKIYSTRLSDPLPVFIEKGTTIEQRVVFTVTPHDPIMSGLITKPDKPVNLKYHSYDTIRIPQIGTSLDCTSRYSIDKDNICQFAFIRFDLYFELPDTYNHILSILSMCRSLSLKPELVLYLTNNIQDDLAKFVNYWLPSEISPARIIVLKQNEPIVSESTIAAAKSVLAQAFPETSLVFGTDRYFVELNRSRNSIDLCDRYCYSLNPQVHTFDNESIMENLPGIDSTIQMAGALFGNKPIHITPITLRPRINRANPSKAGGPDMRLYGLFGAAWTAGALFYSIGNNVESICLLQINGDHGIFDNIRHTVTPAYHVLSKAASFSGGHFRRMTSGTITSIVAFQLQKENRNLFIIANTTNAYQTYEIGIAITGNAQIIDSTTFEQFSADYTMWEKQSRQVTYTNDITLSAYAILLIESVF